MLELRQRVLGPEHPDTLTSMNNLGAALDSSGQHAEAAAMHKQVLEVQQRVLGPEHPAHPDQHEQPGFSAEQQRAACRGCGHAQAGAGGAVSGCWGQSIPHTLTSMNNLGVALDSSGQHAEAAAMHKQVLEVQQRVLGPEHPDTLNSMNNLGAALTAAGSMQRLQPCTSRCWSMQQRVLGPEHPDTLTSMNNLALRWTASGSMQRLQQHAQAGAGDAVSGCWGQSIRDTLTSMNNLGAALGSSGQHAEAAAMHRQVLEAAGSGCWGQSIRTR